MRRWTAILFVACAAANADLADVFLKDGRCLRGDVPRADGQSAAVVVRISNEAGTIAIPADLVDRIEFIEAGDSTAPAQPEPVTQPGAPADDTGTGSSSDKEPLAAQRPLSAAEIQRLRMLELSLDGPAEEVRVRFLSKPNQLDVWREAHQELSRNEGADPDLLERLEKGSPPEKLQALIRATGLKYADRIEVFSDPMAFQTYRRRVLPIVMRGCSGNGCHTGKMSQAFRFPMGEKESDAFVYTSFAMLDGMTVNGLPMINRQAPEESLLLKFLLPYEPPPRKLTSVKESPFDEPRPAAPEPPDIAHPFVGKGRRIPAALRGTRDPNYLAIVDWINVLRNPRPQYFIETVQPAEFQSEPAKSAGDSESTTRPGE